MISFVVPGEPQGKGRARVGSVGNHARLFTPPKTVAYEGLIALSAKQAMAEREPLKGPVHLQIEAAHTVPASWSKKRRQEAIGGLLRPVVKPDWDNIGKAVSDGGNGVLWADDKQIVSVSVERIYSEKPGLRIEVREWKPLPKE